MVTSDLLDLVDLLCGGGRLINPGFALQVVICSNISKHPVKGHSEKNRYITQSVKTYSEAHIQLYDFWQAVSVGLLKVSIKEGGLRMSTIG